jgi:hypothetical protein
LKLLLLKGYPPLVIGLFWMGKMAPIVTAFADEMQKYVSTLLAPRKRSASVVVA